jgi:hypothetical protein
VPNDEIVLISPPLVRNDSFVIVIRCVFEFSRSSAAIVTKSIEGTLKAVVTGRVFNSRRASEIRAWIIDGVR